MLTKHLSFLCVFTVAVALLMACSGKQGAGGIDSRTGAQPSAKAVVPGRLKITSYGPHYTRAGVAFNVQPGGNAALWVRLNQPIESGVVAIDFNGTLLQGNISGNLVTAGIPALLYANSGTFTLYVITRVDGRLMQSNRVTFKVE